MKQLTQRLVVASAILVLLPESLMAWPKSDESNVFDLTKSRQETYFAQESNIFSLNDQATGSGWVSGVRAQQRPGTELVDITYDAFGAGGGALNVTVSVSDDAGATYAVPASYFSGSGYGDNVFAGKSLQIVWNAAGDYDNRRSYKMKVKVVVSGDHGDRNLPSNIFELDTRSIVTGTIEGRVLGDDTPLEGAEIRVEGSSYVAESIADGTFSLPGVPVGKGYVLTAGKYGFSGKRLQDVDVEQGSNDIGDIDLFGVSPPYRVVSLVPDVNPDVLEVEEGGTGYCYYRVLSSEGYPVGLSPISIRIRNGSTISQVGDVSDRWAGRTAGLSDANGIVRLRIPALSIGSSGTTRTLEIVESGRVQQVLGVKVIDRKYDQVWKQSAGIGASAKFTLLRAGASGLYESILRREIADGSPVSESITRRKVAELRAGVEVGAATTISGGGAKARAGAGAYVSLEVDEICVFDPNSTDPAENAIKIYTALGNAIYLAPGLGTLYGFFDKTYGDELIDDYLVSVKTGLRLGVYAEADASIGILDDNVALGAEANLSGEAEGIFGYEQYFSPVEENAFVLGAAMRAEGSLQARAGFSDTAAVQAGLFGYGDIEFKGKLWRKPDVDTPHRVSIEQTVSAGAGAGASAMVSAWGRTVSTNLSVECHKQFREEYNINLSGGLNFDRLKDDAAIWNGLRADSSGSVVDISSPAAMLSSVIQSAAGAGSAVDYERSSYAAYQSSVSEGIDIDIAVLAVGLQFEGSAERGAEVVSERGKLWQFLRMAQESYPELSSSHIPSESFFDIERQWASNIGSALDDLWDSVTEGIMEFLTPDAMQAYGMQVAADFGPVTCTLVHENLSLTVAEGAIPAGTRISFGSTFVVPTNAAPVVYEGFLPQIGASNWIYGIGGIYHLEGDQSFTSNGTLSISYADFEVNGLPESELRIYRIADYADEWTLIGGEVDITNNTVSCSIGRFGTYAVAPPMPVGDLVFNISTNSLPADGISQMSVVVSNIMLNTEQVTTDAWMFDVLAEGIALLNPDANTNLYGHQIVATNGVLDLVLQAPYGGTDAQLSLVSRAGSAQGAMGIPLYDNDAPTEPQDVVAVTGQSRVWVSWSTNSEPDIAGYRVYYRQGQAGPPYDGVANVEGFESPVRASGTNCLLRGLSMGESYYLAVSSVDGSGNESPLVPVGEVVTTEQPPHPPRSVAVRFGDDGTNMLMWALSEDDGYNDRDVVRYDVYRAIMPSGSFDKIAEVDAGTGLFVEESPSIISNQFIRYAIESIDAVSQSSERPMADHFLEDGSVDNDRDGMGDLWEDQYGLDSQNPLDWWQDYDGDGLTNIEEFKVATNPYSEDSDGDRMKDADELVAGTNPNDSSSSFRIIDAWQGEGDGMAFIVEWAAVTGRAYAVLWTPNLSQDYNVLDTGILYPQCTYTDTVHAARSAGFYRVDVRLLDEIDSDGDWLPNAWESQYFSDPTNGAAFIDSDGDGDPNITEFIAGTDPTDPVSYLRASLESPSADGMVVTWAANTNRSYSILWTPTLKDDFQLLEKDLELPQNSYTDTVHKAEASGFYRFKVRMK